MRGSLHRPNCMVLYSGPCSCGAAEAFNDLMVKMQSMMSAADHAEASGVVVYTFDPETSIRRVYGPFPKDTPEAGHWATAHEKGINADGDGPAIEVEVVYLYPPTP